MPGRRHGFRDQVVQLKLARTCKRFKFEKLDSRGEFLIVANTQKRSKLVIRYCLINLVP